ncbi:MAG: hypothetical protein R2909_00090 [Gemmatimonadales bacterium]
MPSLPASSAVVATKTTVRRGRGPFAVSRASSISAAVPAALSEAPLYTESPSGAGAPMPSASQCAVTRTAPASGSEPRTTPTTLALSTSRSSCESPMTSYPPAAA